MFCCLEVEEWDYQNTQWTNTAREEVTGCWGRRTAWAGPPHARQCVEQALTPKPAARWPPCSTLYARILSQSLSGLPVNHPTLLPSAICRRKGGCRKGVFQAKCLTPRSLTLCWHKLLTKGCCCWQLSVPFLFATDYNCICLNLIPD